MTKKKKPKSADDIHVELGTLPFPEFMALVNAATLGAAMAIGMELPKIVELQYHTTRAFQQINATRWNHMMTTFQQLGLAINLPNITLVTDELRAQRPQGKTDVQ